MNQRASVCFYLRTRFSRGFPACQRFRLSSACRTQLARVTSRRIPPAEWGVMIKLGIVHRGLSWGRGSGTVTSRAAPHRRPSSHDGRQRLLIQHGAPPHAQQDGVLLHQPQPPRVHQSFRLGGVGQHQGHHVGLGQQAVQLLHHRQPIKALHRPGDIPLQPHSMGTQPRHSPANQEPMCPAPATRTVAPERVFIFPGSVQSRSRC